MDKNFFLNKKYILAVLLVLFFLKECCTARSPLPNFDMSAVSLFPTKTGLSFLGEAPGDYLGTSISTAGDIDNDGYDDILIGAYKKNGGRGVVYVIYGGKTSSFSNPDLTSLKLDPAKSGFTILGGPNDNLGYSVSTAGDINKDGYDDIILGAYTQNSRKGAAYVIYGGPKSSFSNLDLSSQSLNPATTGFIVKGGISTDMFGDTAPDSLGASVSSAGDIDKDGYDDIIIGAPSQYENGRVYVIYGKEKSLLSNIDLSSQTLDPSTTGFMITRGGYDSRGVGTLVRTAGDINKDGYADIIVGADSFSAVYVIYGRDRSSLNNMLLDPVPLDPATTGFMITGAGYAASTAGDVNKDGYDDILIGDNNRFYSKGIVYVIYGAEKSSLPNLVLSSTTFNPATNGFTITGEDSYNNFGYAVGNAGDVNGDGYDDIIVGASQKNNKIGGAYVIYGGAKSLLKNIDLGLTPLDPATTGFTLTGNNNGDLLGNAVTTAGDFNNDGYADIIVGVYGKNNYQGQALVIHSACAAEKDTCTEVSICQNCNNGRGALKAECRVCPSNCFYSRSDTSCEICNIGYYLSILPSGGTCKQCSSGCSFCTSDVSCQICQQGYALSDSVCVPASPSLSSSSSFSSIQAEEKANQAVSSAVTAVGGVVCVGNSRFPLSALVSKIVQNTRYMNLTVTDELAQIYQTWDTDMISWQVPDALSPSRSDFKTSPMLFARYGIDSPFLANFWPTIMTLLIGLASFITCIVLQKLLKKMKSQGRIYSLIQKLIAGSLNFVVVQAYGCLDEILFYLVLDTKTNPFNSFYSWLSFLCALGFLALGCLFVLSNLRIVKQYQRIKNEGLAKKDMKDLKAFNERNKYWELFYSDFNDDDFLSQSTMAILLIRASLSSLIIAALYDYPLMQTVFLIILDGAIVLFLVMKKPFTTLRATLAQYYFEAITFLVHLCTFSLAMQDSMGNSSEGLTQFISTAIIYLNTALVTGGISFMAIEIYKIISQRVKVNKLKKYESITTQTGETQNTITEGQRQYSEMDTRMRLESFQGNNDTSFAGMEPSHHFNLSMNLNDHSLITDNQVIQRRDQNAIPIVGRPKIRKIRIHQS